MSIKDMPYTTVEQVLRLREAAIEAEEAREALAAALSTVIEDFAHISDENLLFDWQREARAALSRHASTSLPRGDVHPDDAAVGRFAECMKAKLAKARENGRDGWDDPDRCSVEMLCDLLLEHLEKGNDGNYVDIANLAMMLHLRCASSELLRREVLRRDARMKAEVLEKAVREVEQEPDLVRKGLIMAAMIQQLRRQAEEE